MFELYMGKLPDEETAPALDDNTGRTVIVRNMSKVLARYKRPGSQVVVIDRVCARVALAI